MCSKSSVPHLSVLVQDVAVEVEVIGEALGPGALADRHDSGLFRMENPTLLAHWFGIGDGRGEEAIPGDPAVQASPVVVAVGRVGQAPRDERVFLLVGVDALLLAGGAVADAAKRPVLGLALKYKQNFYSTNPKQHQTRHLWGFSEKNSCYLARPFAALNLRK